jgi:hypothetical protein
MSQRENMTAAGAFFLHQPWRITTRVLRRLGAFSPSHALFL